MKKYLSVLLCFIMTLFLLVGCGTDSADSKNTTGVDPAPGETNESEPAGSEDTTENITEDTTEDITDEPSEEQDPAFSPEASLNSLRQAMIGTPNLFAAAYLGCVDTINEVDPILLIKNNLPDFCNNLPFVPEIPKQRILNDVFGELFCILPLDENASVSVNRMNRDNEVTEVLYRSELGDPILLFANTVRYGDIQVNIVDNEGNIATWNPTLSDSYLTPLLNEEGQELLYDFTPYSEHLSYKYHQRLGYSWELPSNEDLIDTSWDVEYVSSDLRTHSHHITFVGDSAHIQWNNGDGNGIRYITAPWSIYEENDVCFIQLDLGEELGERSYALLLSPEHSLIYFYRNFNSLVTPSQEEPLSNVLERTYG